MPGGKKQKSRKTSALVKSLVYFYAALPEIELFILSGKEEEYSIAWII